MRINILTAGFLVFAICWGSTSADAQSCGILNDTANTIGSTTKQNSQRQVATGYTTLPGGGYLFYNTINGHTSDVRAAGYHNDLSVAKNKAPLNNGNIHTAATVIQAAPDGNSGFHLQLTKNSATYAQTGFYFITGASDKYAESEDAVQINGPDASVFLSSYSSDGVNLCINTMSDYADGKKICLYVNALPSGTYNLSLADINEIDTTAYSLLLIDHLQKDSIDLVHTAYSFTINTGDTSTFGARRFEVSLQHKPVAPYSLSSFTGQKISSGVQLSWTAINAGTYTGYTLQKLNGDDSADSLYFTQSDSGINAYKFVDLHPVIGNNVYRLKQNGVNGGITYSATVAVAYNNSGTGGALSLYPNPAKTTINANLTSGVATANVALIYNSMGNLVKQETITAGTWSENISAYKTGIYFILVKDGNGNIVAQSKFVKAE